MTRPTFDARRQTIYDFGGEFLVRCPRCERCATVTAPPEHLFGPVRLLCVACGLVKDQGAAQLAIGEASDWYFGLPLWLQAPCRGHILWAYNPRHLHFLMDYVRAGLRQDTPGKGSRRNATLASRLPAWITCAKHRDEVLRGLGRLQQLLDNC